MAGQGGLFFSYETSKNKGCEERKTSIQISDGGEVGGFSKWQIGTDPFFLSKKEGREPGGSRGWA